MTDPLSYIFGGLVVAVTFTIYYIHFYMTSKEPVNTPPISPELPSDGTSAPDTTTTPSPAPSAPVEPSVSDLYPDWNTQKHAYHNTRVICDRVGLTVEQKNILCACVWQESQFKNSAINKNKNSKGVVTSTDWGIGQVNDYFHCGKGKTFPSVEYVLSNPDKVIEWMAGVLKSTGKLQPWVSYTSGAYLRWLKPDSPMWSLKS